MTPSRHIWVPLLLSPLPRRPASDSILLDEKEVLTSSEIHKFGRRAVTLSIPTSSSQSSSDSDLPMAPPSGSISFRYYQPAVPVKSQPESDDETDDGRSNTHDGRSSNLPMFKRSGACAHCKSLKVKCHFAIGQSVCQRCQVGGFDCTVRGRKKRRAVPTQEELQGRAMKQDMEIMSLLQRIDKLTTDRRIREWLSQAQPQDSSSSRGSDPQFMQYDDRRSSGMSSMYHFNRTPEERSYVERGPSKQELLAYFPYESSNPSELRRLWAPDIITSGLISPTEAHELFKTFFDLINPYFSILDPVLHTPGKTIWHMPFLFTVVCALATRYYPKKANLYDAVMEFAHDAAGKSLVQGHKSVDACQAYLLLAVYPKPKKKWADDRSWLLMGVAFRLATELCLGKQLPEGELSEREQLNRVRTWLNCYCVDASHATQFGKMPMLSENDYVARHAREWYRSSELNQAIDVHLVAYVEVLRVLRHFWNEVGLLDSPEEKNYHEIVFKYHSKLKDLYVEWSDRFQKHPEADAYMCRYRADNFRMNNTYSRLVVLSFGFQKSVKRGVTRDDTIVQECIQTAQGVIKIMTQRLFYTGMLKYSMEAHFLFVSFAAAFLLNLLSPKLPLLLYDEQKDVIVGLVSELISVLKSEAVALDGRHTPYLYAQFLSALLQKYAPVGDGQVSGPPRVVRNPSTVRNDLHDVQYSYEDAQGWNAVIGASSSTNGFGKDHQSGHRYDSTHAGSTGEGVSPIVFQHGTGPELDFSMTNFVQACNQPSFMDVSPPPGQDTHAWWTEVYPENTQRSLPDTWNWPYTSNRVQYM